MVPKGQGANHGQASIWKDYQQLTTVTPTNIITVKTLGQNVWSPCCNTEVDVSPAKTEHCRCTSTCTVFERHVEVLKVAHGPPILTFSRSPSLGDLE
jgi:hypothetical protein